VTLWVAACRASCLPSPFQLRLQPSAFSTACRAAVRYKVSPSPRPMCPCRERSCAERLWDGFLWGGGREGYRGGGGGGDFVSWAQLTVAFPCQAVSSLTCTVSTPARVTVRHKIPPPSISQNVTKPPPSRCGCSLVGPCFPSPYQLLLLSLTGTFSTPPSPPPPSPPIPASCSPLLLTVLPKLKRDPPSLTICSLTCTVTTPARVTVRHKAPPADGVPCC